jgi:hypothetical protein
VWGSRRQVSPTVESQHHEASHPFALLRNVHSPPWLVGMLAWRGSRCARTGRGDDSKSAAHGRTRKIPPRPIPSYGRRCNRPWPGNPELDRRVQQLLARMSVGEKRSVRWSRQDIGSVSAEGMCASSRLGSVLAGGNSIPAALPRDRRQWVALADAYYLASTDTSGGHNAIPVLFGIDAVHGHNNLVGATCFHTISALVRRVIPKLISRNCRRDRRGASRPGLDWTSPLPWPCPGTTGGGAPTRAI